MSKKQPEWGQFRPDATLAQVREAQKQVAEAKEKITAEAVGQINALKDMLSMHVAKKSEQRNV